MHNSSSHFSSEQIQLLRPKEDFIKKSKSATLAIIGFSLLYLLMLAAFILTFILAVGISFKLFRTFPGFLSFMFGLGICALTFVLAIFALKSLFARVIEEKVERIEITKKQQPEFYAFLEQIAQKTAGKMPSKIFFSPGVNAMVFYDSGFLNLFLPIRKNLDIGLGLINTLNVSELEGVIAHEFGHFTQKGIRTGKYFYTVNRIIFGMLYGFDSWDKGLSDMAAGGGIKGRLAYSVIMLTHHVKKIMGRIYDRVILRYMDLSREMEFNADLIAAHTSGKKNFKQALRKIEFSNFAFDYTIMCLNNWVGEQKKSPDILRNHHDVLEFLAHQNGIQFDQNGLNITDSNIEKSIIKSRINLINQWASHPELHDREKNIDQINSEGQSNVSSAWSIISDEENLRYTISELLYDATPQRDTLSSEGTAAFISYVHEQVNKFKINPRYGEYFEDRYLRIHDWEKIRPSDPSLAFEQLFSQENSDFIKRAKINKSDLTIIEHISSKVLPFRYFEFDHKKYSFKNCTEIIAELQITAERAEIELAEMDLQMLGYFYNQSEKHERLLEFRSLFENLSTVEIKLKELDNLILLLNNFHLKLNSKPQWTASEVLELLKEINEIEIRTRGVIDYFDKHELMNQIVHAEDVKFFQTAIERGSAFTAEKLDQEILLKTTQFIQMSHFAVNKISGTAKKKFTDFGIEVSP